MTVHLRTRPDWGDQIIDRLTLEYERQKITRASIGWEVCPRTERLHLQCYAEFPGDHGARGRQIMEYFGAFEEHTQSIPKGHGDSPWPHITRHKGAAIKGWRYTRKDSPDHYTRPGLRGMWWSIGEEPEGNDGVQGKRNDIDGCVAYIRDNPEASVHELAEAGHAAVLMRYPSGANMIRRAYAPRRRQGDPVHVEFTWGPSGTGKTYMAYQRCYALGARSEDIYVKPPGKWWPNYRGQKFVIMDDFRPTKTYTFSMLLRTLDEYPEQVETKGGYVHQNGRYFFITSIMRWDHERMIAYGNHESMVQLGRRISITWKTRTRTDEEKRDDIFPPPVRDEDGIRAIPAQAEGFIMHTPVRPTDPVARTLLQRTDTLSGPEAQSRVVRRRLF